ncbi:MAG: hypothetical protein JO170_34915 [Verrucomicrobia bacterium]|nr:hypothetical protein [Verrucomicrobiota bacterium]
METFAPASGWVAVLISVALAVFLPILTMAITAFCLPRTITKNSGEHWAERARSLYPFKAVRIYSLSLLPLFYATAANFYPDSFRPIPRWIFCIVIFLASFGSTNWTIWWLGRRYQLQPEPFWERLRKTAALTLLYGTIIVFAITAAALPDEWNLRCAVVLCAGILVYLPLIKFLSEFAANPEKGLPLLAWCPVIMAGFIFLNRRRRQMEVRADVFGSQVHEDKSIYARALAKLYQANETPAVMPRKSMPHPHLYDRLRVAGITPDFPRPGRPARWGTRVALLVVVVNVAAFLGIQYFVVDFLDRG